MNIFKLPLLTCFIFTTLLLVESSPMNAQLETNQLELNEELTVSVFEELFSFPLLRGDSLFILTLQDGLELHLKFRKTDHFYNGGKVKVFDVANNTASEFLLSRQGNNYFATFSRNFVQYRIILDNEDKLQLFEDIWTLPLCGNTAEAFKPGIVNPRRARSSSEDSLNILMVYSPVAVQNIQEIVNIQNDTALYIWSNTAVSYVNLSLENSGAIGFCRLAAIEKVSFEPDGLYEALFTIADYKEGLAFLEDIVREECIHIRSFVVGYPELSGVAGVANLFQENSTSLYNSSITNFKVFCHEVGHNLGFGHGPRGGDDLGFFPFSRGYSTQHAGLDGPNLSTMMDYGPRAFWFSNTRRKYHGEVSEHNGIYLGQEDRDHMSTLDGTFPLIEMLSSNWEFIDTLICEGNSVFGHSETGIYRDYFHDPTSCTGYKIRETNLRVIPAIESNFESLDALISFFPGDSTSFSSPSFHPRKYNDSLWLFSTNHIYLYQSDDSEVVKKASFPDPEIGPEPPVDYRHNFIADFLFYKGSIIVQSNLGGTFRYNSIEKIWEPGDWAHLPVFNPETSTMLKQSEGNNQLFRSVDKGLSWVALDIPFTSSLSQRILRDLQMINGIWFVFELGERELWLSKDDGISWHRSDLYFFPAYSNFFGAGDDLLYLGGGGNYYYYSRDGGLTWSMDEELANNYSLVYYSDELNGFVVRDRSFHWYYLCPENYVPLLLKAFYFNSRFYPSLNLLGNLSWDSGPDNHRGITLFELEDLQLFKKKVSICSGENFYGHSESGTYKVKINSPGQCDTLMTVDLTVSDTILIQIDTTICYGSSFQEFFESGNYFNTLPGNEGCDTLVEINLTVLERLNLTVNKSPDTGGGDGKINIVNIEGGSPPYLLFWDNGSNSDSILNLSHGNYQLTISDANSCIYEFDFQIELGSAVDWEYFNNSEISLIPNPVHIKMPFSINAPEEIVIQHRMVGVDGRILTNWQYGRDQIRAPGEPGIYLLQIRTPMGYFVARLVVIDAD